MTRNDNRDRVCAIRQPHGSRSARGAQLLRDRSIAARLAGRNPQERPPHAFLELSTVHLDREVADFSRRPLEVRRQPLARARADRRFAIDDVVRREVEAQPAFESGEAFLGAGEFECAEPCVARESEHRSQRRGQHRARQRQLCLTQRLAIKWPTIAFCFCTSSLIPASARSSSVSSASRPNVSASAVPCTSMKRPLPVFTMFMSTSAPLSSSYARSSSGSVSTMPTLIAAT